MDAPAAGAYGDAFADVYDRWYGASFDGESAGAALARLAGPGAVLELGVGTGRLAVPLAARGIEVWGIEASAAMLEQLERREGGGRVRAVLGDMAEPAAVLGAGAPRFAVIVAAANTFFLLPTEEAQRRCLRSCASLLDRGGVLALECYVPGEPPPTGLRVVSRSPVPAEHAVLTVTTHDAGEPVIRGWHVELDEGGPRVRPWTVRFAAPVALDAMAEAAGLSLRARWGGWDERPFTGESMHVSLYAAQ